jgi:hypothetical protein
MEKYRLLHKGILDFTEQFLEKNSKCLSKIDISSDYAFTVSYHH